MNEKYSKLYFVLVGLVMLILSFLQCFVDHCLSFVLFLLAILVYVLLQLTAFTPYGIFKLFLMSITTSRD
jgi:hypothetical protein